MIDKPPTGKKHRLIIAVDFYIRRNGPEVEDSRTALKKAVEEMMAQFAPKIVFDSMFSVRDDDLTLHDALWELTKENVRGSGTAGHHGSVGTPT
jgi:hypothetical protein